MKDTQNADGSELTQAGLVKEILDEIKPLRKKEPGRHNAYLHRLCGILTNN